MAAIVTSSEGSKELFLSSMELDSYGCRNCVWKNYGQCPKGFIDPEQKVKDGYCTEYGQFILAFGEKEDSISAVMEKFLGYTQRVQALADGKEYHLAVRKLKKFEDTEHPELTDKEHQIKLRKLQVAVTISKNWWAQLTDNAIKNLGKIVDRERRSKDVQGTQKITVQQLNVLLKESDKLLENKNN